jgi:hypothetical protein
MYIAVEAWNRAYFLFHVRKQRDARHEDHCHCSRIKTGPCRHLISQAPTHMIGPQPPISFPISLQLAFLPYVMNFLSLLSLSVSTPFCYFLPSVIVLQQWLNNWHYRCCLQFVYAAKMKEFQPSAAITIRVSACYLRGLFLLYWPHRRPQYRSQTRRNACSFIQYSDDRSKATSKTVPPHSAI